MKGVDLGPGCWRGAWPGAAVDRLVVQQVGPELSVTRELAVYPDVATARAVADKVRVRATRCHRLAATSGQAAMVVTLLGGDHPGAAHVAASFAETTAGGEPGGGVFVFTRVGRAILAVEDSGEWTRGSAVRGARAVERADRRGGGPPVPVPRRGLLSGPSRPVRWFNTRSCARAPAV